MNGSVLTRTGELMKKIKLILVQVSEEASEALVEEEELETTLASTVERLVTNQESALSPKKRDAIMAEHKEVVAQAESHSLRKAEVDSTKSRKPLVLDGKLVEILQSSILLLGVAINSLTSRWLVLPGATLRSILFSQLLPILDGVTIMMLR
jgi:hypothetical protein